MKTKDFLGVEWEIACMGCAISAGSMTVPGGFIQQTENFCVHQDPLVPLPGFLVIASRRHIHSITELQDHEYEEFSALVRTAEQAIKSATNVQYLTIVQEESSIHFHLWLFPWTPSVIEKYGKPSLSRIREIMSDHRKHPLSPEAWKELEDSIEKIKYHWRDMWRRTDR